MLQYRLLTASGNRLPMNFNRLRTVQQNSRSIGVPCDPFTNVFGRWRFTPIRKSETVFGKSYLHEGIISQHAAR